MAIVWWKMQNVTGRDNILDAIDEESYTSLHDKRYLFVWMCMFRRNEEWVKCEPAHHHILAYNHLAFNTGCGRLGWYLCPVGH